MNLKIDANLVQVSPVVFCEDLILVHLHPDVNDWLSGLFSGLWSTPLHSELQYGPDLVKKSSKQC